MSFFFYPLIGMASVLSPLPPQRHTRGESSGRDIPSTAPLGKDGQLQNSLPLQRPLTLDKKNIPVTKWQVEFIKIGDSLEFR